ncbi:MAG: CoA transferase [Deltaproteobacteria bacterium]|nr:CoA transferase [Deltaproteobacteria bacterium]
MFKSALTGIKVIEFATMVSGPYCGKLLADMGADVIKIEPPEGDPARYAGPFPKSGIDPECSSLFLYTNTSKRGITLDINKKADLDIFKDLLTWANVLIDNHSPQVLKDLGLGWEHLNVLNHGLIYTSITPYGRTGPRANVKGDELTIIHGGGLSNLLPARSVDIDRAPVRLGGYPVGYHGGIIAALATIALLLDREKPGKGHLIDISLQEVILNMICPMVTGNRYHKTTWSRVPDRPPAMGRMETSDGYIILGAAEDHHFRAFRELMGKPKWAEDDEWDDMHYRIHHLMDIAPMMEDWMRKQKKDDIHQKAAKKAIPIGPVNTARDVMNYEQYAARGYFVDVDHPKAGKFKYAGWPYKMTESPPRVTRPAPLLGQHNQEVLEDPSIFGKNAQIKSNENNDSEKSTELKNRSLPLHGIRVLDFSWVWAGPYAGMLMANLGAEVIKIEGSKRSDLMRRTFPWPLPEPTPLRCPPNQGMAFNSVNRDKKSLTLDLRLPEGIQVVKKLAAISDVVLDNMRPDAMIKLGLGYKDLRKINPEIIVISSSGRGHEGPESQYLGFATIHHAIGGGTYITGHTDGHPSHGSPGDVDLMNAATAAYATVAALHHRKKTGEGQFIDYSQCEGVSSIIGEVLLGYEMTSEIPERMGNAHPKYAPHNVYKCWGVDRWLALEIRSDEEFTTLARVIHKPELAEDPRFTDMASRKQNEAELDQIIEKWTRQRDRDWMVDEFCKAGLAAAPSRDGRDLYADRHLQARGAFVKINHPELGELEMVGPPWKISDLELPTDHAPLLGEHNQYVLGELLGLSDKEIDDLRQKEVIM